MQNITKLIIFIALVLSVSLLNAQESDQDNSEQIETLKSYKKQVEKEERELLKAEVEIISEQLKSGKISENEAERLKKQAAQKHAKNIENRIAILDNKIELLERNDDASSSDFNDNAISIRFGNDDDDDNAIFIGRHRRKPRKFDRRTTSDLVFAIGFNNAIIEGEKLDDSPYKIGGSGFVELGWAWKTRLLNNSNAIRLKYGFSVQWNKLNIKDNLYFVNTDGNITLEEFPVDVCVSKFRMTNLVFPVHFEFGPSRKIERKNYIRYSTKRQIKIGIGGYGGFNLGTLMKVKYSENGHKIKDKSRKGYNTADLIYGVSGYLALNTVGVYVKYDLSPIFKNQAVKQNNISLGLRFDMD